MYSPCPNSLQRHTYYTKPGQLLYRGIGEIRMLDGCMGLFYLAPEDAQIKESVRLVLEAARNDLIRTRTGEVPWTLWIAAGSHPTTLMVDKKTGAKKCIQHSGGVHLILTTLKPISQPATIFSYSGGTRLGYDCVKRCTKVDKGGSRSRIRKEGKTIWAEGWGNCYRRAVTTKILQV